MQKTLAEIAHILDGEIVGDKSVVIASLSGIKEAQKGSITFVLNPKYFPLIKDSKASAIIVPRDHTFVPGKNLIRVNNPSIAFTKLLSLWSTDQYPQLKGIHPTAIIDKTVILGKDVAIGPYAVIEKGCQIGDRSVIYAGCFIGFETQIGADCSIHPNTTIRHKVSIGQRVTIHSGSVIGCDGFGYEQVDGVHQKIPQTGTVVVEDDVEIGSNVTIDRARFDKTLIGKGTKIDNLVQIAHNVIIGENCVIISQVGISGSSVVEKGAILAGQAGIAGHLTIGAGAIIAAQAGVTKSIPPHTKVSGYPAKPHEQAKKVNACLQRLPNYVELLKDLEKRIQRLEQDHD